MEWMADLSKKYDLRMAIACRTADNREAEHFMKFFPSGNVACLSKSTHDPFSSYAAVDMSSLVVSVNSTLAIEALGLGAKVLMSNPRGFCDFQIENRPDWYCESSDMDEWQDRVMSFISMDKDFFHTNVAKDIHRYMVAADSEPAHVKIQDTLTKTLNSFVTE